ncbi:hypothetical protein ACKKBF_B21770 [Auxenochlorella protothecoides x Auxenochlorella symbiontica]
MPSKYIFACILLLGTAGVALAQVPTLPMGEPPQQVDKADMHRQVQEYLKEHQRRLRQSAAVAPHDREAAALRTLNESKKSERAERRHLVVVLGGDRFNASSWMTDPEHATWDLYLIYYGSNPAKSCPLCTKVFAGQGAKWRLAWRFTLHSDWQLIRKAYKTISFIDDDLEVAGGEVLNTALAVFEAFDLLIAQPSVCNEPGSWTPYRALFTVRSMVLRYVNMVEIMAPIFEMELFDRMVRPTLFDAYFGWGLDWLWPALLSYPPDKVAVIDEVCVYHPKTDRKNSALYKLEAPMTAREEANLHIKEWGWSPEGRAVRGFSSYSCDVISEVARPSPIAAPNLSNFLPGNNTMPSIVAGGIKHWLTRKEPFRLSSLNQLGLLVRTIPVFIMGAGIASVMLYRKKRRSVKRKITLG